MVIKESHWFGKVEAWLNADGYLRTFEFHCHKCGYHATGNTFNIVVDPPTLAASQSAAMVKKHQKQCCVR